MNLGFEVCDWVNYVIHAVQLLTHWCLEMIAERKETL